MDVQNASYLEEQRGCMEKGDGRTEGGGEVETWLREAKVGMPLMGREGHTLSGPNASLCEPLNIFNIFIA